MTNLVDTPKSATADPVMAAIERELRKGNFFVGEERSLVQCLQDDAALVSRLGLDLMDITSRLKRYFEMGRAGLGDPVLVDGCVEVIVREDRGIMACPWGDHYAAPKAVVVARNIQTGTVITYSLLALHLVSAHGFFQGRHSPFRIDPFMLRDFFKCEEL
ncbi:MAG: hypothetical protein QG577_1700 [Thermodesulfobacteriota bacterium]|nr:hypothetical protein [Thermodesulfobacteriota bacterium]